MFVKTKALPLNQLIAQFSKGGKRKPEPKPLVAGGYAEAKRQAARR